MRQQHPGQLSVAISHNTNGDNELVAAVAGKKIRVLSCMMIASGIVSARFESSAGGTALTGRMPLIANSGFTANYNSAGWFETAAGQALNLELTDAIAVNGVLNYDLING